MTDAPGGLSKKQFRFVTIFNAYFGKLTEYDGLSAYLEWVEACDPDVLHDTIKRMSDREPGRRKPTLGSLKECYYMNLTTKKEGKRVMRNVKNIEKVVEDVMQERTTATKDNYRYIPPECGFCNSSGKTWAVWEVTGGDHVIKQHVCKCHWGHRVIDEVFPDMNVYERHHHCAKGWRYHFGTHIEAEKFLASVEAKG